MNRCAVNVGRLLEIRATTGYRTVDDVNAIAAQLARELKKIPAHERVVAVTDWRRCPIMGAEACEQMLRLITRSNPRTERSGAIASRDSPTTVLQVVRLVRDSQHPDRRLFYQIDELTSWLGEVLNPAETARMREFLAEIDAAPV
jgi:hypothetical protein